MTTFSVRRDDGTYAYFEADTPRTWGQEYDKPRGKPIAGMFPPSAWDVVVPNGAKRTGDGPDARGLIATLPRLQRRGLSGTDAASGLGVGVGGFVLGWLIGRALK